MRAKKRSKIKKCVLAYITTKNKLEAKKMGNLLVENRLAACVNIIPSMSSIYRWEKKVECASEAILIVKTTHTQKNRLLIEVKKLHSYSMPCVLFFEVSGGNPDYLDWVNHSVGKIK